MSDYNIFGHCDPKFAKVEEVFRKNFIDGYEFEGASFAAYYKGQLVVDLSGGYADSSALRKWTDKTRTVVFSTTKAVNALCIAILVDRGYVKYEDNVTSFWPEFGQNGKEDITIEMIVNHQAGLPLFSEEVTVEDAQNNPERIAKIIENSPPLWKPGTKSGYHAITIGWLGDQLVRRLDPKHRSIGQFFKEEVAQKHSIDLHIGLPPSEEYTVSRLVSAPGRVVLKELWSTPKMIKLMFSMILAQIMKWGYPQVFTYPSWMGLGEKGKMPINNPELHFIEQTAALGITRAKDLTKLFSLFLRGEIVSKELVKRFYEPVVQGYDAVIPMEAIKGHGFFYEPHPKKPGKYLFGHPGYGGNNVTMDPEEDIVVAYVTNGLKTGAGDGCYCYRVLRNAVFDCLEKFDEKNLNEASRKDAVAASENFIN